MEGEGAAVELCLLRWLESSGGLASLREQCSQYRPAVKAPAVYKLSLVVDPLELLQHDAELGDMLLHFPRQFWLRVQRQCYTVTRCLDWLPACSSPSQLLLELRLSSLPSLPGYTITSPSDLPPLSSEPRFLTLSGVVLASTLLSQYTQSACYHCGQDGCKGGSNDHRYIRLHVAGTSEAQTVRSDVRCQFCGSPLLEDVALRTLANKMMVHLVPSHSLRISPTPLPFNTPSPTHHRHQATPIVLRDGLCEGVRVGGEYSVIGVPVHSLCETSQRAFVSTRLEANNVFCVERRGVSVQEVMAALPHTVTDILSACSYSPWAFSATLAYSFAAELVPPGAYHRLKLAMLLSLASCTARNPLHLLVVAMDTTLLPSLLLYGSSMSSRSTQFTSNSDLWGTTRKEGGDVLVEGGGLVLASSGVCVVGNLRRLKKEKLCRLQHTLESSEIKLPLPSSREEGGVRRSGEQVVTWALSCAVWSFADSGEGGHIHESSPITKALADCMGAVVFCDCPTTDGADFLSELMTQHILDRATGTTSPPPLTHSHLHQLLSVISGLEVSLSPACQQLLRSFYLASRRVRASSLHGTNMPVNSLDIMSGLAEAHARLSLQSEAREEDGVMAILLYEECLTGRYGHSVLHLLPAPHFRDTHLSQYLGKQFDQHMRTLHCHILQFIKSHASGATPTLLMPEE